MPARGAPSPGFARPRRLFVVCPPRNGFFLFRAALLPIRVLCSTSVLFSLALSLFTEFDAGLLFQFFAFRPRDILFICPFICLPDFFPYSYFPVRVPVFFVSIPAALLEDVRGLADVGPERDGSE